MINIKTVIGIMLFIALQMWLIVPVHLRWMVGIPLFLTVAIFIISLKQNKKKLERHTKREKEGKKHER